MLGGGFAGYSGTNFLFFGASVPGGGDLPPGFLQCVRVCRPRAGPTHTPGTEAPKNKETCSLALLEIPSF
jgi:hypothetical protein